MNYTCIRHTLAGNVQANFSGERQQVVARFNGECQSTGAVWGHLFEESSGSLIATFTPSTESVYGVDNDRAEQRKANALTVLGSLGFVDNQDGEAIGTVFHPDVGLVFDCARRGIEDVVKDVFEKGKQTGVEQMQADLRRIIGCRGPSET